LWVQEHFYSKTSTKQRQFSNCKQFLYTVYYAQPDEKIKNLTQTTDGAILTQSLLQNENICIYYVLIKYQAKYSVSSTSNIHKHIWLQPITNVKIR
jgi:hypothetical protein